MRHPAGSYKPKFATWVNAASTFFGNGAARFLASPVRPRASVSQVYFVLVVVFAISSSIYYGCYIDVSYASLSKQGQWRISIKRILT